MKIRSRPSPNHGPRPAPGRIDLLVLHYTGMPTAAAALDRMCDAARRAWHAGRGFWAGATNINDRSVGIELANPGHEHGYRAFPEAQLTSLEQLCRAILARHPISPGRVLGHSDVAPERKQDPGELFPWPRLAQAGIGLWPDFTAPVTGPVGTDAVLAAQRDLARIGYDTRQSGRLDTTTTAVITAFQRHWRPGNCDGALDAETARHIAIRAKAAGASAI